MPIFAVPVGSRTRLPDVELLSLDVPTFGVSGKSVRMPFSIDSSLPREFTTTVTLRSSDGDEVSKEVKIAAMSRTSDFLVWKPKSTGDFTVTLTVPKHGDETLPDNNKLTAPISIREEKLRVLVVESYPGGSIAICATPSRATRASSCRACSFTRASPSPAAATRTTSRRFPAGRDELVQV